MRVDFPFIIPGIRPVLFLLHLHSSAIEQIKLIAFVLNILFSESAMMAKKEIRMLGLIAKPKPRFP
jgi:hypothetical protein